MFDRRELLSRGARAALGASLLPGWMHGAFADGQGPDGSRNELKAGLARARQLGKPLLVLIVPEDRDARYARGKQFGGLFAHGDDAVLASLALVEVVCATRAALDRRFPARALKGEPVAVLVEAAGSPVVLTALRTDIGPSPAPGRPVIEAVREWVRPLGAELSQAIAGDKATLARRAREARAALTDHLGADGLAIALAAVLGVRGEPSNAAVDKVAALFWTSGEQGPAWSVSRQKLLAKAARARLVDAAPAGSRWAFNTGCGVRHQGEKGDRRIACGRGHVPAGARRFLDFYTTAR